MVGFMRWVHKQSLLFLVAVLIPALCGSIYFLSNSRTTKSQGSVIFIQPKPRIICFNSNELKTSMTLELTCPPTYTFLGDGPLVESATADGVVSDSHHPQGLAIDVNYPGDKLGALWLEENGSRFGLCRVYANEWWHFEGVIAPGQACPPLAPNALVDLK